MPDTVKKVRGLLGQIWKWAVIRRYVPYDITGSLKGALKKRGLNAHWSESIDDAGKKIDAWRWDYNETRPHRSLKGLTPREFAVKQALQESQTL